MSDSCASAARWSNRPPGRGVSLRPKISGAAITVRPSRRSRSARPATPCNGFLVGHLEAANELGLRKSARIDRIDPQRTAGPHREFAIAEHHEAGERQALGAADRFAAHRIAEAPVRPRAGIEQHADDRQIERRARALGRRRPRHGLIDFVPVIEAVDVEMPPARMERNVERRIGRARRVDHELRGVDRDGQDRPGNSAAGRRAPASGARARARRRR